MQMQKQFINPVRGMGYFEMDVSVPKTSIVFISMDMVPPEFYGDIPHTLRPRTPHIDALRQEGLFFSHAFSTSPLCSPSRASYLTGRYSYITTNSERAHDGHEIHLRDSDRIFPEYLKAAGYRTRHYGKSHVGTKKFIDIFSENDSPWDRWSPPWYDDDAYRLYLHERGWEPPQFDRIIQGRNPSGEGKGNFYGGWIAPQNGKPFPFEATYPFYLVEKAIQGSVQGADTRTPLYIQLDFFAPHQPFAIPGGMEDREEEIRRTLQFPAGYMNHPDWEPRVYRMYRRYWGIEDPQTLRDYCTANMLQYELLDAAIGKFLKALKNQDMYDNAWIILIADHGEMNGVFGLIDKGAFLNPRVLRAPVFVKPPRSYNLSGKAVISPVSLLDIAPTIYEITGLKITERLDGYSLLRTAKGELRPEDKPILSEVWSHVVQNPCMGIVVPIGQDVWLYACNFSDDVDELYLIKDMDLPVNRFYDAAFESEKQTTLELFHQILVQDPRWAGYVTSFELKYPQFSTKDGDRQKFLK